MVALAVNYQEPVRQYRSVKLALRCTAATLATPRQWLTAPTAAAATAIALPCCYRHDLPQRVGRRQARALQTTSWRSCTVAPLTLDTGSLLADGSKQAANHAITGQLAQHSHVQQNFVHCDAPRLLPKSMMLLINE